MQHGSAVIQMRVDAMIVVVQAATVKTDVVPLRNAAKEDAAPVIPIRGDTPGKLIVAGAAALITMPLALAAVLRRFLPMVQHGETRRGKTLDHQRVQWSTLQKHCFPLLHPCNKGLSQT